MLQAIQILSYIHRFEPSIIVLDEPDSHLHPNNQRLLCALLRRVAEEKGTQVLLTTHSRHVVDSIGAASGFLWVRNGKVDVADPADEVGVLMEIGALDIKERATDPNTKVIVLTEDELIQPLQTLLESSGFDMSGTVILPYFGVTQIKQLRPLVNVIQASNPRARILLHRDRDFLEDSEAEEWAISVRALRVEPFLTIGRDIESHFLNAAYLSSLNGVSIDDMTEILDAALLANQASRVEDYVNGRIDFLRKDGRAANAGALASAAIGIISANGLRFSGKPEIRRVRHQFQQHYQRNLVTYRVAEQLKSDELWAFAATAFGAS